MTPSKLWLEGETEAEAIRGSERTERTEELEVIISLSVIVESDGDATAPGEIEYFSDTETRQREEMEIN
jgi:hypothetical protein